MPNFDLAPPTITVDGLLAVPIDISRINASLVFDAATQIATADASFEFVVGPTGGNPIFDLRQNIEEAWLDGVAVPPAQIAHHDFGGGPDAHLRILERVLAAGSTHTLHLRYTLGIPLAPLPTGRYLPQLTWSAGPRLVFNFGFTDLQPGRYLETWLPANLIYDQFGLEVDIQIINTTIAHSLITNGSVSSLGTNHWVVTFPDRFTALSHLLELRASDSLTSLIDTVLLPVSGSTVNVELWKLATNTTDLVPLMTSVKAFLQDNENDYGSYLHGNRFVVFIISGGMEYDGGTTTGTGALRHETFHSWYGRGVKPASQNDGWWDEAWTEYNMAGASSAVPFNFAEAPVQLFTQNPYARITAGGAYTAGKRFFDGMASLIGIGNLIAFMAEFYRNQNGRPATTAQLEALLLCRSGNQTVVDAFHRFVFGFPNPPAAPDLWLRDAPAHTGSDNWAGRFWDSPDLWVRNEDDNGTSHQSPEFGQDNWLYARVRNRSSSTTAEHFVVAFNVKSFAGTEFRYPDDFLPCLAATSGFGLGPGETRVVKAKWPKSLVPPEGTHACLLASVHTRLEHPSSGTHVWESNNLAQKNLTIVDLSPGDWIVVPFVLDNLGLRKNQKIWLEIVQGSKNGIASFSLLHSEAITIKSPFIENTERAKHQSIDLSRELIECGRENLPETKEHHQNLRFWTSNNVNLTDEHTHDYIIQKFASRRSTKVAFEFKSQNEQYLMGIKVEVPRDATPGEVIKIDVIKRAKPKCFFNKSKTVGGIALEINVCE